MTISDRACCWIGIASAWLLAIQLVFSPAIYYGVLDYVGPSTDYYEPSIVGASVGPDGKYYAYLGDKIYVTYIVVRHRINGSCFMHVRRYGENVGGPAAGKRHLLDYADLQFRGQDELRRPRWPMKGLVLGYDVDKMGRPQTDKPLLEPGVDAQEFALYVVARYYCNFVDFIFPRYLQGGVRPDETERVNIVVRRSRP